MLLTDILARYARTKIKFTNRSVNEYQTTLNKFNAWLGRAATLTDLDDDSLAEFLKHRVQTTSSPTARKDRQQLLTLWRWAWRKRLTETQPRDIPEITVPKKRPRAWRPAEVGAILSACDFAPKLHGWDSRHWKALILTIYDSAERISALLHCPMEGLDANSRTLLIPAKVRKRGTADQLATLHPDTVAAIARTLDQPRDLLFDFPGCYLTLLRHFKKILKSADIDIRNRKIFHDLRRTSYTLTHAALGHRAAMDQCGHTADLSEYYLDTALLADLSPERRVADVIARPTRKEAI